MKFTSTPAWTFAGKRKGHEGDAGPGPGQYDFKKGMQSGGYSLPRAKGTDLEKIQNPVGPGQYNYDYTSFKGNGTSLKGKRSLLLE